MPWIDFPYIRYDASCFCLSLYLHCRSYSAPGSASDLQATYIFLSFKLSVTNIYMSALYMLCWQCISGFSFFLMAYKASPCTHSIPVKLLLTLEMSIERIISDKHELMIEAATSNVALRRPHFPFRFKTEMKDELCKRVHYLSLGSNKDFAAFSQESPLCCLRWIWKRCSVVWK